MAGYEILPVDLEEQIDIADAIERCKALDDPVVNLILRKYQVSCEGWNMFYHMHKCRKDHMDMGRLGIAKLFRAKADAYNDLLQDIALSALAD